jgi:hypothetical protein
MGTEARHPLRPRPQLTRQYVGGSGGRLGLEDDQRTQGLWW